MKQILTIILLMAACGCGRPRQAETPPQPSSLVQRLVADTRSVIVVGDGESRFITNRTGKVLIGNPMQTVGTVTSRQEIAELTAALAETGMHGDSGVCFCGALPSQVFLNAGGEPLVGALVHVDNNHVILYTNLTLLDGQIYYTSPTGEQFEAEFLLPSGDNPKYGRLALQIVKRLCPDECVRRELKGCEDLINARKKADAERKEKERVESLLKLSGQIGGGTTR